MHCSRILNNERYVLEKIEAMRVFLKVKELQSFTKTSSVLSLPKASVSMAIQQLENQLGTRLFHRSTRRVELSPDGEIFFERCKDLLADFDELEQLFKSQRTNLTGRNRCDMPTGLARNLVIPAIPSFLAKHPLLELELSSSDRFVDLLRDGFDCVLRVGSLAVSGLIARRIGQLRLVACASPAYLQRRGRPRNIEELAGHQLIHYSGQFTSRLGSFDYWIHGEEQSQPLPSSITVNNAELYQQACLAGLGIIQAPWVGVRQLVESEQLELILPDLDYGTMPLHILYPHRRNLPHRMLVFMDWLEDIATRFLEEHDRPQ